MQTKLEIAQYSTRDANFESRLQQTLARGSELDPKIDEAARKIVYRVRDQGDEALLEYTREFDNYDNLSSVEQLKVPKAKLEKVARKLPSEVYEAIRVSADRIRAFHEHQLEHSWAYTDEDGSRFGQNITPIEKIGIYVPGGQAAYPSTVLMTAIPARVAGVGRVVMTAPAPNGVIKDSVLAAAYVAGVDRVYKVGGAQAIAALAFGTQSVSKVDKIVGPGNVWVSAAKRLVFGHVGIDLIAGPTEVVVVCDNSTNAEWAAMDMFAQAEHDANAQSIMISTSKKKIAEVRKIMETKLSEMERKDIIANSLASQGALIHVINRHEAAQLINRIAPEHLELMVQNSEKLAGAVVNAGSIFIGQHSAEVLGDYCAGPNHVLPTSGAARFSSPLGVYDFQKRSSIMLCSPKAASKMAKTASILAQEERLYAHALAARLRVVS